MLTLPKHPTTQEFEGVVQLTAPRCECEALHSKQPLDNYLRAWLQEDKFSASICLFHRTQNAFLAVRVLIEPIPFSGRPSLPHPVCSYRWVLSAAKHRGHERDRYRSTPSGALNHPFMLCTADLTSFCTKWLQATCKYTRTRVAFEGNAYLQFTDLNLGQWQAIF